MKLRTAIQEIKSAVVTDWNITSIYLKTTLFLWIFVGVLVNFLQGAMFFSLCAINTTCIIGCVMQLATSDKVSGNWQMARLTFPVSRTLTQVGHFIFIIFVTFLGFVVGVLAAVLTQVWMQILQTPIFFPMWLQYYVGLFVTFCLLIPAAIMLAVISACGFTKALRFFPAIIVLVCLAGGAWISGSGIINEKTTAFFTSLFLSPGRLGMVCVITALLSLVIYFVLMMLAARFYRKRQF